MKRKWLSVLTSLALFVGMIQLSGLALILGPATQASAAPAAINVGTIEMRMQRMSKSAASEDYSNTADCSRVEPAAGNWTSWVTNPAVGRTSHGRPEGGTCPPAVDTSKQSVIEVQPNNPGGVAEGAPFLLGSYKHYNNPVNSASNVYNYSKLQTRLLGTTLTLPWELWETPNNADPCPVGPQGVACHDRLKFDIDVAPEVITYNGERYRMVVTGFVNVASAAACPANPTGLAVGDTFITAEQATTKGCLYAQLDKIRTLTIEKQVVAPQGVTVPAFSYTASSNLGSSDWPSSFQLSPSVTAVASVTHELLSSEKLTITEKLPTDTRWSLTSLSCKDANGAAVPWTNGNGADTSAPPKLVLNNIVGLQNTPTAITCRYVNTYTPRGTLTLIKQVAGGTAVPSNWTLSASGPSTISGASASAAVTNQPVKAGTYTLSETGPNGYAQDGPWTCTGGTVSTTDGVSSVVVADSATVKCTVKNRFQVGNIRVVKTLVDPDGGFIGSATTPFTGTVTCQTPSGTHSWSATMATPWNQANVPAGSSCVVTSEASPSATLLKDTSFEWLPPTFGPAQTVVDGQTVTLNVTNTIRRNLNQLQLRKVVQPANGTAEAFTGGAARTFPLTYSCTLGGSVVASGVVDVAAGASSPQIAVPRGASCSITEPQPDIRPGDFPDGSYSWQAPTLPPPVTITAAHTTAAPAVATVTNTYSRQFGSIRLAKSVTGPGASSLSAAQRFTLTYNCGTGFTGSVTLANGGSETVDNLPLNAQCTIAENPVPTGSTGLSPAFVWGTPTYAPANTVQVAARPSTVTVTNPTIAVFAQVKVNKVLAGATAGLKAGETFTVTVACNAPAQGQSANYTKTFTTLSPAAPVVTDPLPVGTSCSVTEKAPTADQLVDESYAWGTTPAARTVVAQPAGGTAEVSLTNTINRVRGSLKITKALVDPYGVGGSTAFSGTWTCTGNSEVQGTWSRTGAGAATLTGPHDAILYGSTCTVTENTPTPLGAQYAWSGPQVSPDTVTVSSNTPSPTVTVTNTVRQVKSNFSIRKVVEGTGYVAGSTFAFDLVCTNPDDATDTVTYDWTLANNGLGTSDVPLPIGWTCQATESDLPATSNPTRFSWDDIDWSITPQAALTSSNNGYTVRFTVPEVPADASLQLTATNTLRTNYADITVTKVVSGERAGLKPGTTFPVTIDCGVDGIFGPFNLTQGASRTQSVPAGSSCTVTEAAPSSDDLVDASYAWGTTTYAANGGAGSTTPPTVTVTGQGARVSVTNPITRVLGKVAITKVLNDPFSIVDANRTFTGTWACTYGGDTVASGSWTAKAGQSVQLSDRVPLTSTCTATETAPGAPSASDASYVWSPDPVITTVAVDAGMAKVISVTNTVARETGSITVRKTVVDPDGGYAGAGADFTVGYRCTLGTEVREGHLAVTAGASAVTLASGIPYGHQCTVWEDTPSGTLLVDDSFAWGQATINPATFTLSASTPTQRVEVTNPVTRTYGSIAVTKVLRGLDEAPGGFSGTWRCQYGDADPVTGTWQASATGGRARLLDSNAAPFDGRVLTGSVCSFTEAAPPAFSDPSWAWNAPVLSEAVTVPLGGEAVLRVTNTAQRVHAGFTITKKFTGPAWSLVSGATVAGSWQCTHDGEPAISGRWTLPGGGGSVSITQDTDGAKILAGSTCQVREDTLDAALLVDGSYSWATPTWAPAGPDAASGAVETVAGQTPGVTVTNAVTRNLGSVRIAKVVQGAPGTLPTTFTGHFQCVYTGAAATTEDDVTVNGTWSAGDGDSFTENGVLVGSTCRVVDENPLDPPYPDDPSYVWTGTSIGDPVVVTGAEPGTITVTNTMARITSSFAVKKQVVGQAPSADVTFDFTWRCVPGDGHPDLSGEFTLKNSEVWQPDVEIPVGSTCTVTEAAQAAGAPAYTWGTPTFAVSGGGEDYTWTSNGHSATGVLPTNPELRPLLTVTNPVQLNGYTIAKTSDPVSGSQVRPGDVITYTVTVTPTGTVPGLTVTDDLSMVLNKASLVAGSIAPAVGTAQITGTKLVWTIGDLSGAPVTITYKVRVNEGAWNSKLVNLVTGTADVPKLDCTPAECPDSTQHPVPGYTLTKKSDPVSGSAVKPGQVVTYTLTVRNASQAVVREAVVMDDLSKVFANATWVGFVGAHTGASVTGTQLTWDVPDVAVGGEVSLRYQVKVNANTSGKFIENVARPKADTGGECVPAGSQLMPNALAATDDPCSTHHEIPGYVVTKSSDPKSGSTVKPGQVIAYTLTVENTGKVTVTGASVGDSLAQVLPHASLIGPLPSGVKQAGNQLNWQVPDVKPGEKASITYRVKVNADARAVVLKNVATASGEGGCVGDCSTTHKVPGWSLWKTSDPASGSTVAAGSVVRYTVHVQAKDVADATNVVVVDDLSQVLSHADLRGGITTSVGSAVVDGTKLTWTIPTLKAGQTVTMSYDVVVKAARGTVVIRNVVSGTGDVPPSSCDPCSTQHRVPPPQLPNTGLDPVTSSMPALAALFMVSGATLLALNRRRRHA